MFFPVYLDDISTATNNIKTGRCIGEILLNNLMFSDDIFVIYPNVRGCKVYLMCIRLMPNHMELFSTTAIPFV